MNRNFYLERKSQEKKPQILSLGVFTGYTFYPTMPREIFEILVKENKFMIIDDSRHKYSLDEFQTNIDNTFTNNPPIISLNTISENG